MSTQDDRSNYDDSPIEFNPDTNSGERIRKNPKKLNKPRIRVKMEDQTLDGIFDEDDPPYIIKTSSFSKNSDSKNSDGPDDSNKSESSESRNDVNCKSVVFSNNGSSGDSESEFESESEFDSDLNNSDTDNETEGSNDLIDVTPEASVARIKNQVISSRDDDVDGMRRHRNIVGTQGGKHNRGGRNRKDNTRYIPRVKRRAKHPHGYLKVVFGSMYSGKSSELRTDRSDWLSIKGIRILVVNYAHDKRYTNEDMVMTHNKEGVRCISVENLAEITNGECYDEDGNVVLPEDYDLILIDEGQFYTDLKDNIIHWVDILSKTVYVYGLDGDFRRQSFGQIMDLIPLCDEMVKKKANCMICNNGTEALFTWKLENNDDEALTVDIGADEKYVALCRKHYNRLNRPQVVITGNVYSKK